MPGQVRGTSTSLVTCVGPVCHQALAIRALRRRGEVKPVLAQGDPTGESLLAASLGW